MPMNDLDKFKGAAVQKNGHLNIFTRNINMSPYHVSLTQIWL